MRASSRIDVINALAELERYGWKYEPCGSDEVKIVCPVHKDTTPSAVLNTKKNLWNCRASQCHAKGDVVTLLAYILKTKRDVILFDLAKRYDLSEEKSLNPEVIEKAHKRIKEAGPLLQALYDRGVSDEMIRDARIGYADGRITIPVYDNAKRIVNIRKYLPGAEASKKMKNVPGYGSIRIYQIEQIEKYECIWICGGELKALVAGALLNKFNIGAISATAGEGAWDIKWNHMFKGKRLFVCMDIDSAGVAASHKLGEYLGASCASLAIITLPLDEKKYPKGDINDYIGGEKADGKDLLRLMETARLFEPQTVIEDVEKGTRQTTLDRVTDPDNIGYRVEFEAVISAMDTTPFLVPKELNVSCTKDQPGCSFCPFFREKEDASGYMLGVIPSTSKGILEIVNVPNKGQREAVRKALRIPACKVVEFTAKFHYSVADVRLSPQLQISSENGGNVAQPAFIVAQKVDLNTPYIMKGRVYPDPKTQQATLVLDELEETQDSLSNFSISDSELSALRVFQQLPGQSIENKLAHIYEDLSNNCTGIFGRNDLHFVLDLAFHSPLRIHYGNGDINGWLNALIVGDSSQGKSETSVKLMHHYQLGERVECKNATVPGLLGGVQQLGSRWFVSWGIIPVHDRRLLFLEELKGASKEVIAKLTDVRSSGIAEISKIEKRRAYARTRLVAISNPRSTRPISAFSFGIEALHELIGSLEDLRRFDIALILAAGQVNLDSMAKKEVEHVYTSELCKKLILWAWTLKPEDIVICDELALDRGAKLLCSKFTEALPLIDRGTIKHKIIRLATSLAIRLFNYKTETNKVYVTSDFIEYVVSFIDRVYSDPVFGYSEYTKAQTTLSTITDKAAVEKFIIKSTKHPGDLVHGILYRDDISQMDIQDWCEVDRDAASTILSFLVRTHCILRHTRNVYVKTPDFINLLKSIKIPKTKAIEEVEM